MYKINNYLCYSLVFQIIIDQRQTDQANATRERIRERGVVCEVGEDRIGWGIRE